MLILFAFAQLGNDQGDMIIPCLLLIMATCMHSYLNAHAAVISSKQAKDDKGITRHFDFIPVIPIPVQ